MQQEFFAGIDVGNFETKSPGCSFLSGFTELTLEPFGVTKEDYIKKEGKFYVLDQKSFPYVQDKTVDDHMAILTLIAIAKEMRTYYESMHKDEPHADLSVRQDIGKVQTVHLGVGLPPAHLSALKEKVADYYKSFFGGGVNFTYNGIDYSFKLGKIGVYPQNFAAIIAFNKSSNPDSIISVYEDYYSFDWGGYTLDKIAITNNKLDLAGSDSFDDGIVVLCDKLKAQLMKDTGRSIDDSAIFKVLKGKKTPLPAEVTDFIKKYTESWTHEVMNKLAQSGVNYFARPVIFMGGTSLLLKPYIESYNKISCMEFFDDPCMNAAAYRKLIKHTVMNGK